MTEHPPDPSSPPAAGSDAGSWLPRGLAWGLLVIAEAALVLVLMPYGQVFTGDSTQHLFELVVLGLLGAVGWVVVIWRPSSISPYLVVAPLPLLAAVVVTALPSAYPTLSWPAAWQSFAYAGVFWLLVRQASQPMGRLALIVVVGLVVVAALLSFALAVLTEWGHWLDLGFPVTSLPIRPSNVGGLTIIPTWMADVLALGAPVAVAALWRRGARAVAVVFAIVVLGAIVVTGTRSVLLIAAVATIAAILLAIRGRVGGRTANAVVTAMVVLAIVGAVVVLGTGRSLDEGRSSAYASAIARIAESPLIGAGPGTYGVERMSDPVDFLGYLAFPDAHNIVLNNLAESGIVGLLGLLATVGLLVRNVGNSWRRSPDERIVIGGALVGLAIFAAHGMVDVVFGLVGIILLALAIAAIAATDGNPAEPVRRAGPLTMRIGLVVAGLIAVVITVATFNTERTVRTVGAAERALARDPAHALELARRATAGAPDMVSAWWAQMVAADATGDSAAAIDAARHVTALEGFGQQWISLAILAARHGDASTEASAIAASSGRLPIDPVVELNAAALLADRGDAAAADAARRLLTIQPDIEPILAGGPGPLADAVAAVRGDVARQLLAAGDRGGAFLVALSGHDRALSDELLANVRSTAAGGTPWPTIVDAWFGDETARATLDRAARADPTLDRMLWSWRLAGNACDLTAMTFWERAARIGFGARATTPNRLDQAPAASARQLPSAYPSYIWRQGHPRYPYVDGTLTFSSGRPLCHTAAS